MFRKQMGMSPHKYLLQMRIAHAQELLATTPYSFEQVSVYCGFANAQHFAKTFRQRVGLTPGEYRQRNQREPSKLSDAQRIAPLEEFHETSSD
jgi:transcriptional regulator GlxA family with amidase domain